MALSGWPGGDLRSLDLFLAPVEEEDVVSFPMGSGSQLTVIWNKERVYVIESHSARCPPLGFCLRIHSKTPMVHYNNLEWPWCRVTLTFTEIFYCADQEPVVHFDVML